MLHIISFRYEMTYKFRENGYSVDYLVDFSVTTDLKNSRYPVTNEEISCLMHSVGGSLILTSLGLGWRENT